jgi:1,4-dihydroxy-2-naphthoyl-CoA hydrolase
MSLIYQRTVRFADTDAAGVVYFANLLSFCHEAYEASLINFGINVKEFFANSNLAIPIAKADINFYRPLYCGDKVEIRLEPHLVSQDTFAIAYTLWTTASPDVIVGHANTRHVCIQPSLRQHRPLPEPILAWLEVHQVPA